MKVKIGDVEIDGIGIEEVLVILRGYNKQVSKPVERKELVSEEMKRKVEELFSDAPVSKAVKTKVEKVKKRRYRRAASMTRQPYGEEEQKKIKAFWDAPENHDKGGWVIRKNLVKFAKEVGRTPEAISTYMSTSGIRKHRVLGLPKGGGVALNASIARAALQAKRAGTAPPVFPNFPSVKEQEIARTVLKHLVRMGGVLRFEPDAFILGIEEPGQWVEFCVELLQNSVRVAEYFGVKNKFVVEGEGRQKVIRYVAPVSE